MWRGSTTAFSRKTVESPNADAASRAAASMDSRSCAGSSTRRIPRPPPPATALTNTGKPTSSAARTSSSTSVEGSEEPSTGTPAARAAATARALLPVSSSDLRARPDEGDARLLARPRQVGVLGQEPVARVHRVRARLLRRADDLLDGEIGPHRVPRLADLIGLVGLQPVQRVAVLVREDGDGSRAQLIAGAERANRDLTTVGDQYLAEHSRSLQPAGDEHHGVGDEQIRRRTRSDLLPGEAPCNSAVGQQ